MTTTNTAATVPSFRAAFTTTTVPGFRGWLGLTVADAPSILARFADADVLSFRAA